MWIKNEDFSKQDAVLSKIIDHEKQRQEDQISLIASENYASPAVMALQGSCLTNKYAEGYPGRRYYAGCQFVDEAETLAIERAKALFHVEAANVQPHSGSQANAAVFLGLLEPGDLILGMGLKEGGHLTHGFPVNFSGRIYQSVAYGLDPKTADIDYDQVMSMAKKHKPKMIIAGFSAFSGTLDWAKFREIADHVGAYLLADIAHVAGFIAAGIYPSPADVADIMTSTTHKTLRGPRGGIILSGNHSSLSKKINAGLFPGTQGGPLMHVIAAKALAFKEAMSDEFVGYQQQVLSNANAMMQALQEKGIQTVMPKTDTHQFSIDLSDHDYSGLVFENKLEQANIIVNKNTIPGDKRSPFETSGLRLGTAAITTRGMQETQSKTLADCIAQIIHSPDDDDLIHSIAEKVKALCQHYPVYTD